MLTKLIRYIKKHKWFFIGGLILLAIIIDSWVKGLDWSQWATEPGNGNQPLFLFGRDLWSWLELLIVPFVLTVGGYLFQWSQKKTEQDIAKANRLDSALDNYLSTMNNLIEKGLLTASEDSPLRSTARTHTLIILRRLDAKRNEFVIQFLQETKLLQKPKEQDSPIITFANANLHKVDLLSADLVKVNFRKAILMDARFIFANLQEADLQGAMLQEANLSLANLQLADLSQAYLKDAKLRLANLQGANLQGANLQGANLQGANLQGAKLYGANLQETIFLETIMPDGSTFLKSTDLNKFTNPELR